MIGSRMLLVALVSGGLGAATLQVVRAASAVRPAAGVSVQKLDDDGDHYPHMRKALHDLHAAKDSLDDAEPRFKGHRDAAIEHVNAAIRECEAALSEG